MLPDILIIGAQKAATTTLFDALSAHPDVVAARAPWSGQQVKELHFFDSGWAAGPDWYASHYGHREGRGLDATPNYLPFEHTHARMREVVPAARLVVSLRNPISRAYSQFNHYKQVMPDSRSWDWLVPDGDFAQNVRAESELDAPLEPRYRGLIGRGYYIDQLESLVRHFPREQVHVMVLEHWRSDPLRSIAALLEFLGLPQAELPVRMAHRREYSVGRIKRDTRRLLQSLYEEPNARLFEFLGAEIPEWDQRVG
jgi:hypothetical protein